MYKYYKILPLLYAILMLVVFVIVAVIVSSVFKIDSTLGILFAGFIIAVITYYISAIKISATIVRTEAVLEIQELIREEALTKLE